MHGVICRQAAFVERIVTTTCAFRLRRTLNAVRRRIHGMRPRLREAPGGQRDTANYAECRSLSSSDRREVYFCRNAIGGFVNDRKDILRGTLDLLILRIVARESMHGWGIMQRLRQLTDELFQVTPGALFPALQRIEEKGWVRGKWGTSENNRRAKFYSITAAGRRQLVRAEENWKSIALAVSKVLEGA